MRKLCALTLALVLLFCLSGTVLGAAPPVADQAGLLTDQQQSDLNTFFGKIRESEGYAVNVVTTNSLEGKSAQDYTEDFYDAHIGGDGVLLMVCLEEGYWYISTNGSCYERISDGTANAIGESVVELIRSEAYYDAFFRFGQLVQKEMNREAAPRSRSSAKALLVCLLIGLAAGGITVGVMAVQMKSVRSRAGAANYVCQDSLRVTASHDIYLYHTTTRTPRPKSGSSGGGGGSRGGSGGRI